MSPQISISIDVPDMTKAIAFYSKALACTVVREGEKISQLSADNIKIYLFNKAAGTNPLIRGTSSRQYDRHWTPVHLDFIISNIEQVLPLVKENGGFHNKKILSFEDNHF